MKNVFVILLSLLPCIGFSQTIDSVDNYVLTNYELLYNAPTKKITPDMGLSIFVPKMEEIKMADSIIRVYLLKHNDNLRNFFLQLMFVIDAEGKKTVVLYGACLLVEKGQSAAFLKSLWDIFADGGNCAFSTRVDLQRKQVIDFYYQGGGG
jgi:hypothetical protein